MNTSIFSQTLASTPDYMITLHEHTPPSNKVIISFGGIESELSEKGFASDFSIKCGWDNIFVSQRAETQYQELSVDAFVDAIAPTLNERSTFTYGSSLGAYCALYYGGAVDAKIIALSPRNSAHPTVARQRFSSLTFMHHELKEVTLASRSPVVIFDPFVKEDKTFIQSWVIPAYPDATFVQLPFAGHQVARSMNQSGELEKFVISIIEHDTVPEVKLVKEGGSRWHCERGHHYWKSGDIQAAEREFRKSLGIQIEQRAVNGLLRVLLAQNRKTDLLDTIGDLAFAEAIEMLPPGLKRRLLNAIGL